MSTVVLMVMTIVISLLFIGLLSDKDEDEVMNQFCYSECVEGKHYKRKNNQINIF